MQDPGSLPLALPQVGVSRSRQVRGAARDDVPDSGSGDRSRPAPIGSAAVAQARRGPIKTALPPARRHSAATAPPLPRHAPAAARPALAARRLLPLRPPAGLR